MILMADSTVKAIQDLKIGDRIMGTNSTPKVVELITKSIDKVYDITPIKGDKYTVSGNHYLLLKASNYERIRWDDTRQRYQVYWMENFKIISKTFLVKKYKSKDHAYKEAKKFLKKTAPLREGYVKYGDIVKIKINKYHELKKHIRDMYKGFTTGADFGEDDVELDPYILGYWLGDGTTSKPEITTAEKEVIEYYKKFAEEHSLVVKKYRKYHYNLTTGRHCGPGSNAFINYLKEYNVFRDKHIPIEYMTSSREDRLKLLAGLVDSDGHNNRNSYAFIFKSEKLANDVIFLARSLGFNTYGSECEKICTNSSRGRVTGTYYRFHISGEGKEDVPSLLKRKKCHKKFYKRKSNVSAIHIKKSAKEQTVYNIKTSGSNRILLADFTVVHC